MAETNEQNATMVDWDTYDLGAAAKPKKAFPPKGNYMLRIPTLKTSLASDTPDSIFKSGDQGQLKAEVGPLFIVGGDYDGTEIRFATISNKRYSNRNASQMGDYLLAANSPFRPQTEEQWKQAVLATSGGLVEAHCDWEAYDKIDKKTKAEGMENFPAVATEPHGYQRWVDVPENPANPQGKKRRVWANLRIAYFRVPRKEAAGATLNTAKQSPAALL